MAVFARLTNIPAPRWTDGNGKPCAGWWLRWKDSETSDLANVWADAFGMAPQQNPMRLNIDGSLPNGGDVFGDTSKLYDLDVLDPSGAVRWTAENIMPGGGVSAWILLEPRSVYGNPSEFRRAGESMPIVNGIENNPNSVPTSAALHSHATDFDNPHKTDKSQVGLGNVPNEDWKDADLSPVTVNAENIAKFATTAIAQSLVNWFRQIGGKINGIITALSDKADKADIPEVNDAIITIRQGGVVKDAFTLNQAKDKIIDLDAGGGGGGGETLIPRFWLEPRDNGEVHLMMTYNPYWGNYFITEEGDGIYIAEDNIRRYIQEVIV